MRNSTIAVRQNPWANIEQLCLRDAREFVTASAEAAIERARDAGLAPSEAAIREAEVSALTHMVASTMALNAELSARLGRLEHAGLWCRLRRWWYRVCD